MGFYALLSIGAQFAHQLEERLRLSMLVLSDIGCGQPLDASCQLYVLFVLVRLLEGNHKHSPGLEKVVGGISFFCRLVICLPAAFLCQCHLTREDKGQQREKNEM